MWLCSCLSRRLCLWRYDGSLRFLLALVLVPFDIRFPKVRNGWGVIIITVVFAKPYVVRLIVSHFIIYYYKHLHVSDEAMSCQNTRGRK